MRRRPLYFMIKPPPPVAAEIAALGASRPAELLHLTLLPLGDRLRDATPPLDAFIALGSAIQAPGFRVVFDRLVGSGRTLALRGSEPIRGALAFQARLVDALAEAGFISTYRFAPHITLDYRATTQSAEAVEPISWLVEEFLLIESVVGERRHITHARWPLPARRD